MKAYLAFLGGMLLCSYVAGMLLVKHFRPSVELLERTTSVTGQLHFVDQGRGGYIARLNGMDFICRTNFVGFGEECQERLPALQEGTRLTAAIAFVPAVTHVVPLTMSIAVDGTQIYAVTPQQALDEWNRSSREALFTGPKIVLVLLFMVPLIASIRFRRFLMSSFG